MSDIDIAFRNRKTIRIGQPRNFIDRVKDKIRKILTNKSAYEVTLESPSLEFYRTELPNILKDIGKDLTLLYIVAEDIKNGKDINWHQLLTLSKPLTDGIVKAVGIIIKKDPKWIDKNTDLAYFIYLCKEILEIIDIKRIVNLGGEIKTLLTKDKQGSGI